MNKKYINIQFLSILIFGILLSLTSCEGALDSIFGGYLDENPDNRLELDTEDKIRKVLVSAYPQSSYFLLTEMASDNTDENMSTAYSAYSITQEQNYRWQDIIGDDVDTPYDIWRKFYDAIQTACAAIDAIDDLRNQGKITDENAANGIEAEARLCRAYGHFVLVNLFSKSYSTTTSATDPGIPYILNAETNLLVEYDRGTVAHVYAKIEEDIVKAMPYISHIKVSTTTSTSGLLKYHWNKEAANAFAARFFLYYKKYAESIQYATAALGDSPSTKLRNWSADGKTVSNASLSNKAFIATTQAANFLLVPAESLWGRVHGLTYSGKRFAMQSTTYKEIASSNNTLPISGVIPYRSLTALSGAIAVTPKIGEYFEYYDKVAGIGWTHIVQALFTSDDTLLARAEAYALSGDLERATKDLATFVAAFTYNGLNYNGGKITRDANTLIDFMRQSDTDDATKTTKHDYDPRSTSNYKFKKPIHLEGLSEDQKDVLQGVLLAKRALNVHEGTRWFDVNRYKIEIYRRQIYDGIPVPTDKLTVDDPRRLFQIPQQMVAAGMQANPRP